MKKFNPKKGVSQFSFMKVKRAYGNFPISIEAVYTDAFDWIDCSMDANTRNVLDCAENGVKTLKFIVVDQSENICFPEFSLEELIN